MKRYIDDYGMLMEDWHGDGGLGDSLWRTAIYSIIEPSHTKHLYSCFCDGYVYRHPLDRLKEYNDCSRDQTIMALVAFTKNKKPLPGIRRKLSDKHRQTFDMVWWIKALDGSRFHGFLFVSFWRLALPILFSWNNLLWKFGKYWEWQFPFYAFHLLSWMVYVLPNSRSKTKLNNYCRAWLWENCTDNILLRLLHGETFSRNYDVNPVTDFRWQRRSDRMPPGVHLYPYDGEYAIDVDILNAI